MIANLTYYEICCYFLLYSFLGWVVEVCYQAVTKAKIVNRGFLNGPVCPVYGLGALALLLLLSACQVTNVAEANPLLLFVVGMVVTTAIELLAGWLLDVLFHARWWDYSARPFQFRGYICLEFSILWGLSVTFAAKIIHPFVQGVSVTLIPERYGWPILGVLYLLYLADFIVTVCMLRGLNKRLEELDAIQRQMRVLSDRMSEQIGENALEAAQKLQEAKVQGALGRAELREDLETRKKELAESRQELRKQAEAHYRTLYASRHVGVGRFLLAFPSMHHNKYDQVVEELKARFSEKK